MSRHPRFVAPGRALGALLALALAASLAMLPTAAHARSKSKHASASHESKSASKAEKVDINTASASELEALPGVGTVMAQKIVNGRPYKSVADLSHAGIPSSTIASLRGHVMASRVSMSSSQSHEAPKASRMESKHEERGSESSGGRSSGRSHESAKAAGGPVDINSASQAELEALPGVGAATAKKIIAGRPYQSVDDLARAGVSKRTIGQISGSVTAGGAAAAASNGGSGSKRKGWFGLGKSKSGDHAADTRAAGSAPETRTEPRAEKMEPTRIMQPPPSGHGMVWVNLDSKIYHHEGDRWYGKTKNGKYMSEQDAIDAGYRASKTGGGSSGQ